MSPGKGSKIMANDTRSECLHCETQFTKDDTDAVDGRFCGEDCENEYEPDVCDECNEELDPAWEHECPMIECEKCENEYNENTEHNGCPYCEDED